MKIINKIGLKNFIYICLLFASLIFISAMCIWAALDKSSADVEIVDAEVLVEDNIRREYLAGEEISQEGISLQIGKNSISDVTLTCDTSTAGLKKVEVSYQDGNIYYRGYFSITVFTVRHYDLRNQPELYRDDNGNLQCGGVEIWVELNAEPTEFVTVGGYKTTIALPSSMYETTVLQDEENASEYSLTINCTAATLSYYYVDIGSRIIMLDSQNRILELTNQNGTQETLKLYVTQAGSEARGYYVFTAANGEKTVLQFSYYLDGWTSHFTSSSFNEGLTESQTGDDYEAVYGGVTFRADANSWHRAILNW